MAERLAFEFALKPLPDVMPWGEPQAPCLHWFGLTDGWYQVVLDGTPLYGPTDPKDDPLRYVDYMVVRLWEDLLDVLGTVLQPVPRPVFDLLGDARRFAAWRGACQALGQSDDARARDTAGQASGWLYGRVLGAWHLLHAPSLAFGRHGDRIRCCALSAACAGDGAGAWAPIHGVWEYTAQAFVDAVRDFDRRLLSAMQARIDQCAADNPLPHIHLDLNALRREQADRRQWLEQALARPIEPLDGAALIAANQHGLPGHLIF